MSVRSRYKSWKKLVYKRRLWNIGFVAFSEKTIFNPLQIAWLEHDYSDGWFADPFIIRDDGECLDVLVEHFVYAENRGHIARLAIRRRNGRYRLEHIVPVIRDGTHFSFPNFYRDGDRIFIHPENWESGQAPTYVYDPMTDRTQPVGSLYAGPLVDAVMTRAFGRPRLFATRQDRDPSGRKLDILVSECDDWHGPYAFESEYVFADRSARGAGRFFSLGDRLIRVAQDNEGVYGGGLVFFEVDYNGERFSFEEIARHLPASKRYPLGLHTFNVHGRTAAVDGRGYAYPLKRAVFGLKQRFRRGKRIGNPSRPTVVT